MTPGPSNFELFVQCLSEPMKKLYLSSPGCPPSLRGSRERIQRRKLRNKLQHLVDGKAEYKTGTQMDETDFKVLITNVALHIFMSFPPDLRSVTYRAMQKNPNFAGTYCSRLPISTMAQICSNIPDYAKELLQRFLSIDKDAQIRELFFPVINDYIKAATQNDGSCDLCQRNRFKLTKHHLVPKAMHERALKEGWYDEQSLSQIAWLCRACHEVVHNKITPIMLAKKYASIDLLLKRSDIRQWTKTVGRVVRRIR